MRFLFLLSVCLANMTYAMSASYFSKLNQSEQFVLVTTHNSTFFRGILQRYERLSSLNSWEKVGPPIQVVLGKKGLAFDSDLSNFNQKTEGDNKTPIGIFPISLLFGYEKIFSNKKMPYLFLGGIECVDDSHSVFYNQLVQSKKFNKDWFSSEKMDESPLNQYRMPLYFLGAYIGYNNPPKMNAGSCIFLHVWRSFSEGTAGCIAMDVSSLRTLLNWLDHKKHPMIGIFPEKMIALKKFLHKHSIHYFNES